LPLQKWGWALGRRGSCWSEFPGAKGQEEQEGVFGGEFCVPLSQGPGKLP